MIKDYASKDKNTAASTSQAVALHGSAESREQAVARKKDPAERFTESVDKLVEKLEGINDNLSRQTKQNEYLVKKLEDLPRLLSPLPAAVNQQRDALVEMIEQLRRRRAAASQTLSRCRVAGVRRSLEAIGTIFRPPRTIKIARHSAGLRKLSKLDAEVNGEIEWLQKMSQSFTENEKFLRDTLTAQQRKFFRLFAVVVGVSLAAITALVVILLLFLYR